MDQKSLETPRKLKKVVKKQCTFSTGLGSADNKALDIQKNERKHRDIIEIPTLISILMNRKC